MYIQRDDVSLLCRHCFASFEKGLRNVILCAVEVFFSNKPQISYTVSVTTIHCATLYIVVVKPEGNGVHDNGKNAKNTSSKSHIKYSTFSSLS